jgi:hypothetical protein
MRLHAAKKSQALDQTSNVFKSIETARLMTEKWHKPANFDGGTAPSFCH